MKNKLNIFLALALLVLTVFTFGCKAEVDLGGDAKKWNNLQSIGGNSQNLLQIKADGYDIDWWAITDEEDIVIEDYEMKVVSSVEGQTVEDVKETGKILKGTLVELKFNFEKNTNVVLWIGQDARVPKQAKNDDGTDLPAGSRDYRGRIPVGPNQGYIAVDNAYREEVNPVGIIDIKCNETGKENPTDGLTVGNWHGNYRITEVWPLSQKTDSPEWVATEGLKFILGEGNYIEEGSSKKFIWPAGKITVLALKQPDRFVEGKDDAAKIEKQKDWYWCLPFCDEGEIEIEEDEETTTGAIKFNKLEAHKTVPVNSSSCNLYFKLGTFYKSALGAEYVVDEFYAADEK